jgi:chorismate synthase
MLRFLTAGESHGKGLVVIIEGMPAGIPISQEFIAFEMKKRMKGAGAGGRMLIEEDKVEIMSGIRFGKTIGSPIAMLIENKDYKNWGDKMSIDQQSKEVMDSARVTEPRPGHADLAGIQKYGFDDVRNVLERASARETTARVAAGAIFKQFLLQYKIEIASHTLQIGSIKVEKEYTFEDVKKTYENDPEIRCVDQSTSQKMKQLIKKTRLEMNTLGGVVEVWANNVPVGLGSYVHWDRKIDGQISQALMSIPSVKAVEIGSGVNNASQFGSDVHDEIFYEKDYFRKTNRAGGIEGGMTNGMPVVARVYHKPISTLYKPMNTVDIITKKPVKATVERSDICIVPRGGVVSEAMLAFVIADNMLIKYGSDK